MAQVSFANGTEDKKGLVQTDVGSFFSGTKKSQLRPEATGITCHYHAPVQPPKPEHKINTIATPTAVIEATKKVEESRKSRLRELELVRQQREEELELVRQEKVERFREQDLARKQEEEDEKNKSSILANVEFNKPGSGKFVASVMWRDPNIPKFFEMIQLPHQYIGKTKTQEAVLQALVSFYGTYWAQVAYKDHDYADKLEDQIYSMVDFARYYHGHELDYRVSQVIE